MTREPIGRCRLNTGAQPGTMPARNAAWSEIIVAGKGSASGRLDVVATPIGNLADVSQRARDALAAADVVAAEDTRRSGQLLSALGLQKPLVSLHAHNERERGEALLARLLAGEVVALVSDAGTPLLSDPGFDLVRRAAASGVEVRAIPGPTAIAAALSVAGIATDRFCFEGFLPAKAGERRTRLQALALETRTLVFFEAPHRIEEVLRDCAAVFGSEREAAVARELTKLHESVYRGSLAELARRAAEEAEFKLGEITLVIAGSAVAKSGEETDPAATLERRMLMERTLRAALPHLQASKAAAIAAAVSGASRDEAYARAIELAAERR